MKDLVDTINTALVDEVQIYANGILHCSVCVPKNMERDEISAAVNRQNPAGTSAGWVISHEPAFASGDPNPSPCEKDAARLHYLMAC